MDVESSSSAVQQPPSSTSAIVSIPFLGTADNAQMTIQLQQQQPPTPSPAVSGGGGSSNVVAPPNASTSNTPGGGGVVVGGGGGGLICGNQSGNAGNMHDSGEPPAKKSMLENPSTSSSTQSSSSSSSSSQLASASAQQEKLEYRLSGILCCAVCLDLPKAAMYQCQMGHLMCAACFTHLLADGRLRDQTPTCPNCRVEISKGTASRNLAVEKAVAELPSECQFCGKEFPRKSLDRHESQECQERPTNCRYTCIGCQWRGPNHEAAEHERNCLHPKKSGHEVFNALELFDGHMKEERKVFTTLIELLSYEKIFFNDLQMKPYRTDEYVHKLFYQTARFAAFNHEWVVKARINNSQRDPHQSSERTLTYQLILKTKTTTPMSVHFFVLKGPFSDMKVSTQIYKHDFTEQSSESDYYVMPLPDSSECNRLLSNKGINFRFIMFMLTK